MQIPDSFTIRREGIITFRKECEVEGADVDGLFMMVRSMKRVLLDPKENDKSGVSQEYIMMDWRNKIGNAIDLMEINQGVMTTFSSFSELGEEEKSIYDTKKDERGILKYLVTYMTSRSKSNPGETLVHVGNICLYCVENGKLHLQHRFVVELPEWHSFETHWKILFIDETSYFLIARDQGIVFTFTFSFYDKRKSKLKLVFRKNRKTDHVNDSYSNSGFNCIHQMELDKNIIFLTGFTEGLAMVDTKNKKSRRVKTGFISFLNSVVKSSLSQQEILVLGMFDCVRLFEIDGNKLKQICKIPHPPIRARYSHKICNNLITFGNTSSIHFLFPSERLIFKQNLDLGEVLLSREERRYFPVSLSNYCFYNLFAGENLKMLIVQSNSKISVFSILGLKVEESYERLEWKDMIADRNERLLFLKTKIHEWKYFTINLLHIDHTKNINISKFLL